MTSSFPRNTSLFRFPLLLLGGILISPASGQTSVDPATHMSAPGRTFSLLAESYDSVDAIRKDLQVRSVTAEFAYHLAKPWLRPLAVGASVSVYDAGGQLQPEDRSLAALPVDTRGVGASLFLRYYAVESERFSTFVDASAGVVRFQDAFPPGGTQNNGAARFGVGVQARLTDSTSVMTGLRWMHISNGGGLNADNPGYDSNGAYVGVSYRPGGKNPPRTAVRPPWPGRPASTVDARSGLIYSAVGGHFDEASGFVLHTLEGEYEWHPGGCSWLGLTAALSVHRAEGRLIDPNHGLGLVNPQSTGFGWHLGVRPTWSLTDTLDLYAEASYGGSRFNRSWPLTAHAGRFVEPWTWAGTVRYGAGVRWRWTENCAVLVGWRHLSMDTSDARPGDAPDLSGYGPLIGLQQRF